MVEGFVGLPGSGKTYYVSLLGLKAIKAKRKVYCNYKLEGAEYYQNLKEVLNVREGVIIVDEINLVCPSRWWDRFPPELAYFWSQTRKFKLDVYWTAQHPDRVDKIVKEITNYIWIIHKLPFGLRYMNCYIPEQINKTKRQNFGTRVFYISKSVCKKFNTYELIHPADHLMNLRNTIYRVRINYPERAPKLRAGIPKLPMD